MKVRVMMILLCLAAMPLAANDLSRLQAILLDSQNDKVTISPDVWRVSSNEAVVLANRIKGGSATSGDADTTSGMFDQLKSGTGFTSSGNSSLPGLG